MVYIVNDSRKVVSCRSRNNNFLSAGIDVCLSFCFGGIETGALQNYIYTKLAPRTIVCIGLFIDLDCLAFYCDRACLVISCYLIFFANSNVSALRRIIL